MINTSTDENDKRSWRLQLDNIRHDINQSKKAFSKALAEINAVIKEAREFLKTATSPVPRK